MRILLFTCDYKPMLGGIAEYTYQIARAMSKRHHVVVLAPHVKGCEAFDRQQPFTTHRYRNTALKRNLTSIRDLGRIVRKERIDLIFNSMYFPAGLLSYLYTRRHRIPYTVSAHGTEVLEARSSPAQLLKLFMRPLRRAIFNRSLVTFAVSRYTRGKILKTGVMPKQVVVMPNGVDLEYLALTTSEQRRVLPKNKVALLTIARMIDYKGQDMVLRAMPAVLAHHPDAHYYLAGTGPYEHELRRLVRELDLAKNVTFLGAVSDKMKLRLYNSCDLFIMASRAYEQRPDVEGFGISFTEAHGYRKPVIAGNSGGIPDAVLDRKTGLLVDPWDPEDIARAINTLIDKPAYAHKLGEQGYARVQRELNWPLIVQRMEAEIQRRMRGRS